MEVSSLKKSIITDFRLNGLSVKGNVCDYLISQLQPLDPKERDIWLKKIIEYIQKKKTLSDPIIEKDHIISAIDECCKIESDSFDDVLNVINAFNFPEFYYCQDSKKFLRQTYSNNLLFGPAQDRIKLFSNRFILLKQRISRHSVFSNLESQDGTKLCSVDYLLSCASKDVKVIVFGMISQLKEGKYYLEDDTGILPVNLCNTIYHNGLFTENCFVLAEGIYENKVLHIEYLAMPPPEPSEISRIYFGDVNTFGGPSELSLKNSSRMLKIEQENEETMIVFVADIWLDNSKVINKLMIMFAGYNEYSPAAFVLMGNFLSKPYGSQHTIILRNKFKELSEIIVQYENLLKDTLFVIIPGPTDSPHANILPKPALPNYIIKEFKERVPNSIFTSNPCRIQYCTQEIVVFREDIFTKMCMNCIAFPEGEETSKHFVKTILSQGYLTPVPISVCPIYWNKSSALSLYPLPDIVVIADKKPPFKITQKDCTVFNPGSFSDHQYCFNVYMPGKKEVEESVIPDD